MRKVRVAQTTFACPSNALQPACDNETRVAAKLTVFNLLKPRDYLTYQQA